MRGTALLKGVEEVSTKLSTCAASSIMATSKCTSRRSRISTPVSVVHTTDARCKQ